MHANYNLRYQESYSPEYPPLHQVTSARPGPRVVVDERVKARVQGLKGTHHTTRGEREAGGHTPVCDGRSGTVPKRLVVANPPHTRWYNMCPLIAFVSPRGF